MLFFLTITGFNGMFWALVGGMRFIAYSLSESSFAHSGRLLSRSPYSSYGRFVRDGSPDKDNSGATEARVNAREVAVMIPAHNEEGTLSQTIRSLTTQISPSQIYVGSDASSDHTASIAKKLRCHVADIHPNRGKAGVLAYLLEHFRLLDKYKVILVLDADSEVSPNYFSKGLPLFDDPKIVAVAGHANTKWKSHWVPRLQMFYIAYRVRVWRFLQAILRYGQTWRFSNVTFIVPGFASMYRSSAMRHINVNPGGLVIEDYNMTFEIHKKRLGKVAYHPGAFGTTRDPFTFRDYWRQLRRWNLGFWQTVRRHGVWPSFFWLSLGAFLAELFLYSVFLFAVVPFALFWFATHSFAPLIIPLPYPFFDIILSPIDLIIGLFIADYLITVGVAVYERKPIVMLYGIGFIILRYVDTFLFLYALPLAFLTRSDGKWISPKREAKQ